MSQSEYLPYGRQTIDDDDINAVIEVLRSDWLTTGPKVSEFEQVFAEFIGTTEAVAVSSGTAALHASMHALGISQGDEVILSPLTFVSSANCVVFEGGTPVFADVDPNTLLLDPKKVASKITPLTKAIIAVDYAGQPCDYNALSEIGKQHDIPVVSDSCHALGATYNGNRAGTLALLSVFSLHPVKHITSGEGGVVTTNDTKLAKSMRKFRNHGINLEHRNRKNWEYEVTDLGYNYRITDMQCALAISQLQKLPNFIKRRREIASLYNSAFENISEFQPLDVRPEVQHSYHLYVVKIDTEKLGRDRLNIFTEIRDQYIGANVHYIPIHLHSFYRKKFGTGPGLCPIAESAYNQIISLPIFPSMTDEDVNRVINAILRLRNL